MDTSAWIAFFSARDQNHAPAEHMFREAVKRRVPLITTNLILTEVHRLVLHRVGIDAAARALAIMDTAPQVEIVHATAAHHVTAKVWLADFPGGKLTYTDAVTFSVMKEEQCASFLGFDADFVTAGFSLFA